MAKLTLFEYAVLCHPTPDEVKKGKDTVLIQSPRVKLATDEREIVMTAAREIPKAYQNKLSRCEVAVRPF